MPFPCTFAHTLIFSLIHIHQSYNNNNNNNNNDSNNNKNRIY